MPVHLKPDLQEGYSYSNNEIHSTNESSNSSDRHNLSGNVTLHVYSAVLLLLGQKLEENPRGLSNVASSTTASTYRLSVQ
ncbi:hypothetical protein OUZ56_021103 [Daphnia magna]|uniref:Uncharacterized protein n=1 Tax=Daphnia magna TaxID=35525 RepID=A0ABQ9ZGE6_9CRUS|nr:hypothetical protein OUZ56_021103 [Daphnia magna]